MASAGCEPRNGAVDTIYHRNLINYSFLLSFVLCSDQMANYVVCLIVQRLILSVLLSTCEYSRSTTHFSSTPRPSRVFRQKLRKTMKNILHRKPARDLEPLCGNFTSRSARPVLQYYVRCSAAMEWSTVTEQTSGDFGWQSRKILSISLIKRKTFWPAERTAVRLENFIWIIAWVLLKADTCDGQLFLCFRREFSLLSSFSKTKCLDVWKWLLSLTRNRSQRVSRLCGVIHRKWKRLHLIYASDRSRHLHAELQGIPLFSTLHASDLIGRLARKEK